MTVKKTLCFGSTKEVICEQLWYELAQPSYDIGHTVLKRR